MWLYQCLDITATFTEILGLYLFGSWLCKNPRFCSHVSKLIIFGVRFAVVFGLTWFSDIGAYKMPFMFLLDVVILKVCYKDSFFQSLLSIEMSWTATSLLSEGIGILIGNWIYGENLLVLINGISLLRMEIYIITLLVRILTFWFSYRISRKFLYQVDFKDFMVVTIVFIAEIMASMYSGVGHLNLHKVSGAILYITQTIFPAFFIIIFIYVKNTVCLREKEQEDRMQFIQLQQQFSYYQEKQRDEEKVRSIYHDMKNHLLVLESSQNTEETRRMAQQLRSQVEDYEDYIHTGNDFLDIIIKDKAGKAREKQIDFSAVIDFSNVDFIDPLDISTFFGNGIDNAIEASGKLPTEERVILIKAVKVQNFVSILIENNCISDSGMDDNRTTKADKFLHGFGISNMKKAAEKYGGTCTTSQANGKFTLKILLPVSKGKVVD